MTREFIVIHPQAAPGDALRGHLQDLDLTPVRIGEGLAALRLIEELNETGLGCAGVLLGSCLPDVDGTTLATVIKSRYPQIPVLMVSYRSPGQCGEERDLSSLDGVFPWPLPVPEVLQRLRELRMPPEHLSPVPFSEPDSTEQGAYLLLSLERPCDAVAILAHLLAQTEVVSADPVVGEVDLVLQLRGADQEALSRVALGMGAIPGVSIAAFLPWRPAPSEPFLRPFLDSMRSRKRDGSVPGIRPGTEGLIREFLLIEATPVAAEGIHARLILARGVTACETVGGPSCQLVALVQTSHIDEIERMIRRYLAPMPGLLRLRRLKVICRPKHCLSPEVSGT